MAERNPYVPAHVTAGSKRVSVIQHTNVETSDVARSQEWYQKVFEARLTSVLSKKSGTPSPRPCATQRGT